ncbi:MAG: hypothetical protein R6W92_02375, partial [Desulfocurvibacter africanus]
MPTPLDLSTLIAQMPHVSKVQSATASHPDAQQAVLAQHVAEVRMIAGDAKNSRAAPQYSHSAWSYHCHNSG